MGKTKASGSEPDPQPNNASMDWREIEYRECSSDWRHRDQLIWATLPVAATITAVILGAAYGDITDGRLWLRFCLLLIGVSLAFVMLISLIKHRFYQQGSEEQIRSLLNIKDWYSNPRIHRPCAFEVRDITPSKKFDAKLTSWSRRRSGFKWMLRGTLLAVAILGVLAAVTFGQLIVVIVKLVLD